MKELIDRYRYLEKNYNYLCFKCIVGEYNIIYVYSNQGIIALEVKKEVYDSFNVSEENYLKYASSLESATINKLDSITFDNVEYFIIDGDNLKKYIGNRSNVVIPNNVKVIETNAFKDNSFIESVSGENVSDVYHYAFRNNDRLKRIAFPNMQYLHNIYNCPNLKEYVLSNKLTSFSNEDNNFNGSSITISGKENHTYKFDDSLESELFKKINGRKSNPFEEVQIVKLNKNDRKFRTIREIPFNYLITSLSNIDRMYESLPESVKYIIENNDYDIYLVSGLDSAGVFVNELNLIMYDEHQFMFCFYHEIGHLLDFYLNRISSSSSFIEIFNIEKDNLYKKSKTRKKIFFGENQFDHFVSTPVEFFAECFQRYMVNDEDFKNECPLSYEYIDNLINNLEYELKNQKKLSLINKG